MTIHPDDQRRVNELFKILDDVVSDLHDKGVEKEDIKERIDDLLGE